MRLSRLIRHKAALIYDWPDLWTDGILSPPKKGILKSWDYQLTSGRENQSCQIADGITVNSKYLENKSLELGHEKNNVALIKEGAWLDRIQPVDKQVARQKINISPDSFVLGFAGFFHPDTIMLADTIDILLQRGHRDVVLLLAGRLPNDLYNSLIEKIGSSHLIAP